MNEAQVWKLINRASKDSEDLLKALRKRREAINYNAYSTYFNSGFNAEYKQELLLEPTLLVTDYLDCKVYPSFILTSERRWDAGAKLVDWMFNLIPNGVLQAVVAIPLISVRPNMRLLSKLSKRFECDVEAILAATGEAYVGTWCGIIYTAVHSTQATFQITSWTPAGRRTVLLSDLEIESILNSMNEFGGLGAGI